MQRLKSIELLQKVNGCEENYLQEYEYLLIDTEFPQLSVENLFNSLDKEKISYISSKIEEMLNSTLYERTSFIHGKKHIENVMLFAGIISYFEELSNQDRNLLMESAKYHDQGRVNDLDELHGVQSAYILGEDLKDLYTEEEIKIMQAAIIFHDDRTQGETISERENNGFDEIVSKLRLSSDDRKRARLIGNILKDADALDRARFVPNFNPIDEKFLRTKSSKTLIKLAFMLHEAYAKDELKELLESEDKKTKDDVNDYSNATSPIRARFYYKRLNQK